MPDDVKQQDGEVMRMWKRFMAKGSAPADHDKLALLLLLCAAALARHAAEVDGLSPRAAAVYCSAECLSERQGVLEQRRRDMHVNNCLAEARSMLQDAAWWGLLEERGGTR